MSWQQGQGYFAPPPPSWTGPGGPTHDHSWTQPSVPVDPSHFSSYNAPFDHGQVRVYPPSLRGPPSCQGHPHQTQRFQPRPTDPSPESIPQDESIVNSVIDHVLKEDSDAGDGDSQALGEEPAQPSRTEERDTEFLMSLMQGSTSRGRSSTAPSTSVPPQIASHSNLLFLQHGDAELGRHTRVSGKDLIKEVDAEDTDVPGVRSPGASLGPSRTQTRDRSQSDVQLPAPRLPWVPGDVRDLWGDCPTHSP